MRESTTRELTKDELQQEREAAANRMAGQGWELRKISATLEHQSVSTTEQYLRSLKDDELDENHMGLF